MVAKPRVLRGTMCRRQFLALCALGAVPSLLAACQEESPMHQAPPARVGEATPYPTAGASDWMSLEVSLQGTLVRSDSPNYGVASQLYDPAFDTVLPMAIAYCATPADVQACLAFARRFGVSLVPRAGGHSYGGYSTTTGLVLDVTRMNDVELDTAAGIATIGAGARLIDVYAALAPAGLTLPAGSCPTVGIAGLTQGGGVGVLDRKFGLTCDSLLSAQVVTADGRLRNCNSVEEPDLFWALRGGGGGNFGVVTSFAFRVYPVATLSIFTLDWTWDTAQTVVDAWQHWAPVAPDELWSNCLLLASLDAATTPVVRVNGAYVGGVPALQTLLSQLVSQIGTGPSSSYMGESGLLDTMLVEANCAGLSVEACHLSSQGGQLLRQNFGAKSDFFDQTLPTTGIENLVSAIAHRQDSPQLGFGFIALDASGGAINEVDPGGTAFVHRSSIFSMQYYATWNPRDSAAVIAANQSWLADSWQKMRPYASGEAYQNYIDPDLVDWQNAYYGSNLPRLRRIKAAYDPSNFFHFNQSIPPESA